MKSLVQIAAEVSGYDPSALPVAQAREFIARLVPRVTAVEMLPLRSALGRVLARDVVSAFDVPAHDNAAMDGYALRAGDLAADAPTRLAMATTGSRTIMPNSAAPTLSASQATAISRSRPL